MVIQKLARQLHSWFHAGTQRRKQETMMRYDDYRTRGEYQNNNSALRNFGRWLSTRPFESWGFFIAGLVIAGIIF